MRAPFPTIFLARRNMAARRGRTLLTLVGIILGVAVVLAIQVTNATTLDSLNQVFDRTVGQADLSVVSRNQAEDPLDDDVLVKVRRYPGVMQAVPSLAARSLLLSDASDWQIAFSMTGVAQGSFFTLYGIDPLLDPQVRVYVLAAGRMPREDRYEVVIPEQMARDKDLAIGQDLVLLDANSKPQPLEIVGLLSGEGVALLNDGVVGFASLEVVQDLFDRRGELDEIALRLDPHIGDNPNSLEAFKSGLNDRLGTDAEAIYPASRGQLVSQMLATYQTGLTFFSLIAIFVGAFLIYNAFSMTVVERTREIGMLRALGMGRLQVLGMVLAEAGLLSLAGSAVGVLLGYALARFLIAILGEVVIAGQRTIQLDLPTVLQSVAVGVLTTLVAALLPALQAARVTPLDALRARMRLLTPAKPIIWITGLLLMFVGYYASYYVAWPAELLFIAGNFTLGCFLLGATLTVTLAVRLLEYLTRPLATLLYGSEGALGSANVRRAIGRTTLTVASLMTALTMIIGIQSLAFAFQTDLQDWIDNALGGDLYVRAPLPMRESFARQLAAVPGVEHITPSRILTVRAAPGTLQAAGLASGGEVDEQFYYEALDPLTFRQFGDMEFAAPSEHGNRGDSASYWATLERGQAVFISSVVAERYGLHQGDQIILLTRRGQQPFTIAAEVVDFGGQGQVIYGTYADMRRFFSEQGVDRFTLSVAPGHSIEAVQQEIETRFQSTHHVSVQTTQAFKTTILDLVDQSFRLFDVLSWIGVIIGALGVINTLTMNVIERQREIGGLRSLGMTRSQVLRMVLAEALALGVMGGLYGAAVGFLVAQVIILGTNMMIGYDLVYRFTAAPYLTSALIALVIVQLAALSPARRAARTNIVEAIKHE